MQNTSLAALLGAILLAVPVMGTAQVTQGALTITGGFSRAMLPNAPVAGGFMTIANSGADDRLIAVRSPDAAEVQVHEMTMNGSVMKMRQLPDGLPVPAGQTVKLTPGGIHLMFLKIPKPFVQGQVIHATLQFENAGEIEVPLTVGPVNARTGDNLPAADAHSGH